MSSIARVLIPCPVKVRPVPTHVCADDSGVAGRPERIVELDGERLTLQEAADKCGISTAAVHNRLARGWTLEKALTTRKQGNCGR